MTNQEEEFLKLDIKRCVAELSKDGQNTKEKVKGLLTECLEVYFKDFSMSEEK